MTPRCTSRWSTSTATSPPKRRTTPSATRIGSGLGTPGRASTPTSAARAAADLEVLDAEPLDWAGAGVLARREPEPGAPSPAPTRREVSSAGIERQLLLVAEQA